MASLLFPVALLMAVICVSDGQTCNKIVTSNVGLTPTVGEVSERSPIVAREYSTLDADVVCSQEFWHEEDIIRVLRDSPSFEYHYSPIHDSLSKLQPDKRKRKISLKWFWKKITEEKAACSALESSFLGLLLVPCAARCIGRDSQNAFAECIIDKCQSTLRRASEDCVSCIFQTVASSLKESITKCHSFTRGRRYNPTGLLLLSKKRILSHSYKRFFSQRMMLQRGYIEAEIEDVGTVVCTHLSSNLGAFFEYDFPDHIGNYEIQQREEIDLLNEAFGDRPHILLGDMNTGPEIENNQDAEKNVSGEFPENYAHLISLGYQSPYVSEVGKCTYCTDNKIVARRYPNHIIDHILLKGDGYTFDSAERILDFNDPEPMSDHYGVRMNVCTNNK